MPLLPPPRLPEEPPAASLIGRTLEEYVRLFAVDLTRLRGCAVLDVAAGSSSFAWEASRRGVDAVAVDPLYRNAAGALAHRIQEQHGRFGQQPDRARLSGRGFSRSAEADRSAAAQRFLADYEGNARHGRYVRGALPALPFLDGAFDLVLCARLLFVHPGRFDFAWHLAACTELVRVGAGEVRIHPLGDSGGRPWPETGRLRRELRARGIAARTVPAGGEFPPGRDCMLVLSRVARAARCNRSPPAAGAGGLRAARAR